MKADAAIFVNTDGPDDMPEMIVRFVPEGAEVGSQKLARNLSGAPLVEFYDPKIKAIELENDLFGKFVAGCWLDDLEDIGDQDISLDGGTVLTNAAIMNAMLAISRQATLEAVTRLFVDAPEEALSDVLSDLIHEAADEAGIPEGDERDDFRRQKLLGYDFTTQAAADIIAEMNIPAHRIRPILQNDTIIPFSEVEP